jgi:hypothetical protein
MTSACVLSKHAVFAQILIQTLQLYIIQLCVSKFPSGTHTKSNCKWIPKYVDCDIQKGMCEYCLPVEQIQSSYSC